MIFRPGLSGGSVIHARFNTSIYIWSHSGYSHRNFSKRALLYELTHAIGAVNVHADALYSETANGRALVKLYTHRNQKFHKDIFPHFRIRTDLVLQPHC